MTRAGLWHQATRAKSASSKRPVGSLLCAHPPSPLHRSRGPSVPSIHHHALTAPSPCVPWPDPVHLQFPSETSPYHHLSFKIWRFPEDAFPMAPKGCLFSHIPCNQDPRVKVDIFLASLGSPPDHVFLQSLALWHSCDLDTLPPSSLSPPGHTSSFDGSQASSPLQILSLFVIAAFPRNAILILWHLSCFTSLSYMIFPSLYFSYLLWSLHPGQFAPPLKSWMPTLSSQTIHILLV